jgi:prepilin-type N-terminal cleavage/methylation domain-containing protein
MESNMQRFRSTQGFTLIELMIVVVIIGILAAIAIPRFGAVSRSAKESEADGILKQAYTLQEAYFQRYGHYANQTHLAETGWERPTDSEHYSYEVKAPPTSAASVAFCTEATEKTPSTGNTRLPRTKRMRQDRQVALGACAGT